MNIKRRMIRAAVVSAAVFAALPLAACGNAKPVKSNLPPIERPAANAGWQQGEEAAAPAQPNASPVQNADVPAQGGYLETSGDTAHYYIDGTLQTGGIVGNDADGFYYADAQGNINLNYSDGVSVNGTDWCVVNGKATPVQSDEDKVLFAACQTTAKFTTPDMSAEEKLHACFDHIKSDFLEGSRRETPPEGTEWETDWPVTYANDLFVYGKGECFSYGAAYAYMGKAMGFTDCYACSSGIHGWAEIDGKYYDPEWDMHHNEYNHFGVLPTDPCDIDYSESVRDDEGWMRIKI